MTLRPFTLRWLAFAACSAVCGQTQPGPRIPVHIVRFEPDSTPNPSRVYYTQAISVQGSANLPAGIASLSIRVFEGTKDRLKLLARTLPPEDGCVYFYSRLYPAEYRAGTVSLKEVTAGEAWLSVESENDVAKYALRRYVFVLESGRLPDGRIGIQAHDAAAYFDAGFEVVVYAQYRDNRPLPAKVVARAARSGAGASASVVVPAEGAPPVQPVSQGPLRRPACLTLTSPKRAVTAGLVPAESDGPACDQFLGN